MRKIKAIFFDFDGTLYTLKMDWENLKKKVFRLLGKDYSQDLSLTDVIYEIQEEKLRKEVFDFISQEELKGVKEGEPKRGAKDFLIACRRQGIKTGIISRNSHCAIELAIKKAKFPLFEVILGREDVKFPKPHSEGLLKALDCLKITNQESVYIGDNEDIDGEFAKSCRVEFIHFQNWNEVKIWK